MKKIFWVLLISIITVIVIFICIFPQIEFYKGEYLYMMSYSNDWIESEDLIELEENMCYDESYAYNIKRDISIISWEYKNFLFFKWFKVKFKDGNVCATEYMLEESYINKFLNEAKIIYNDDKIDLGKLIKGKRAIVGNKRYPLSDDRKYIGYNLDGEFTEMFITINEDGLIIIQVGLGDEGPKYIAYK